MFESDIQIENYVYLVVGKNENLTKIVKMLQYNKFIIELLNII